MAWSSVITDIVTQPDLDLQLSNYYLASEVDSELSAKLNVVAGTANDLRITNYTAAADSAVPKSALDSAVSTINTSLAGKADLTGATFTGAITVPTATVAGNPVRLDQLGNYLPTSGGTVTGPIVYASAPATGTQLANKTYVDGVAALKADITYVDSELANKADTSALTVKANLSGATFTGAVVVPEPNQADDSQTAATTHFVNLRVAADIAQKADIDAPTINDITLTGTTVAPTQLAGDNTTSIATTAFVTNAVDTVAAAKANINSPVFTGTPTAPLPALADDSNQLATTAWVRDLLIDAGVLP